MATDCSSSDCPNFSDDPKSDTPLPGGNEGKEVVALDTPKGLAHRIWATFGGAIVFYTLLPWPRFWPVTFQGIARLAPGIGVGLGLALAGVDTVLAHLGMPNLTRSGLVVLLWIWFTGGLHLDGAMDTADGLAVTDPDRRLLVMADSATGAFGAIVAIALVLLKTLALSEQTLPLWLALPAASGWGRWAQVVAIVWYPYLKPQGKGLLHKTALQSNWEILPGLILLLALVGVGIIYVPDQPAAILATIGLGSTIALGVGAWFCWRLGGHTGDTYGAVVEWTEALMLVSLTLI